MQLVGSWPKTTVAGSREQRIAWVADRQRGLISRRQLRAIGVSSSTIDRMLRAGELRRIHAGVYVFGHHAPVALADETAALLALRHGTVLSHRTAAILWGLRPPGSGDGRVHALVPGGGCAGGPEGVCTHRTCDLRPTDTRFRYDLPVTSPARAMLDVAPELADRQLELALDQAIVSRLLTPGELAQLASRCAGRPGCAGLAALLTDVDRATTLTRSEAEERFLELVRTAQLPAPRVNIRAGDRERDFRWPAQRLLVEVDGWNFHRTRRAFEDDRRRDAEARAAGLSTMRVTCRQLLDEPMAVAARLAAALASG